MPSDLTNYFSDTEWVHVGNDHIESNKFKISNAHEYNKPKGVLWLSERRKENKSFCSWFLVLTAPKRKHISDKLFEEEVNEKGIVHKKCKCCIVKLSNDANILALDSKDKLKKLDSKYIIKDDRYNYCLDYVQISYDYDGIFISEGIDASFKHFECDSLVIFNSNIIESYAPALVERTIFETPFFSEYDFEIKNEADFIKMEKPKCIKKLILKKGDNYETR